MMLKLEVILLATSLIGALGQIVQIPNSPTKEIGGFVQAGFIEVDEEDGRVYVSDRHNDFVRVFNEDGDLILTIKQGFNDPLGMAMSKTGVLYTADLYNHRVVMTTKDGFLLGTIGTFGSGNGQFNVPHDVAIGPDSLLYVLEWTNRRIQVLTLDGQFVKKIDLPSYAISIAFGTDGRLHVTFEHLRKILVFDANGTQVQSVNVGYIPVQIDIDSSGYIYVAGRNHVTGGHVSHNHCVSIYDEYYNLLRTITGFTNYGGLGIARWEGRNEIWVTNYTGGKLYAFSGP